MMMQLNDTPEVAAALELQYLAMLELYEAAQVFPSREQTAAKMDQMKREAIQSLED